MNSEPKKDHFGFNPEYLTPTKQDGNNIVGFDPLFTKVGEDIEIPIEENVVFDPKWVEDITTTLTDEVDEIVNGSTPDMFVAAPFHYDKETQMIHLVANGQRVQVDINEMPEALQEKIKKAEEKGLDKIKESG